jgi:hypothetical protein
MSIPAVNRSSFVALMLALGGLTYSFQARAAPTWVHVPGALVRSDCVYTAPTNADIDTAHGNITLNGKLLQHFEPCPESAKPTRPVKTSSPQSRASNSVPGAAAGGWIEGAEHDGGIPGGESFNELFSAWYVPPLPPTTGALIYMFDGLEPSDQSEIAQPVLQYGVFVPPNGGTPIGLPNQWTIASWLVVNGVAIVVSPNGAVNPGDQIVAWIQITSQVGSTLNWKITIRDNSLTNYWTSATFSYIGNPWTYAYIGVLEAYGVTECSQLNAGGNNGYYDIPTASLYYGNPNANTLVYYGNELTFNANIYAYDPYMSPSYEGPDCGFDWRWMGFFRFFW